MPRYTKVTIFLKDSTNHVEYNKRIIEYLNDRHMALNDNMFTVALEVIDDTNINNYVLQGIESIPAMQIGKEDGYIYGVNSILAMLAKLEIIDNEGNTIPDVSQKFQQPRQDPKSNMPMNTYITSDPDENSSEMNAFYNMAIEEMTSNEPEDADTPSTIRARREDFAETPMDKKMIEGRLEAMSKIYEDRRRKHNRGGQVQSREPLRATSQKSSRDIVDNFIEKGGYDKMDTILMKRITENL